MTGIKDPTELSKVKQVENDEKQMNVVAKRTFSDLNFGQDFFKAEFFRTMLDDLKVRFDQYCEENRSIFDLFSLSHLKEWLQRDQ